jgi:hypothetical protein
VKDTTIHCSIIIFQCKTLLASSHILDQLLCHHSVIVVLTKEQNVPAVTSESLALCARYSYPTKPLHYLAISSKEPNMELSTNNFPVTRFKWHSIPVRDGDSLHHWVQTASGISTLLSLRTYGSSPKGKIRIAFLFHLVLGIHFTFDPVTVLWLHQ